MNKTTVVLLAMVLASATLTARAETPRRDFSEIWMRVQAGSPALEGASRSSEAREVAASRAARHWFPTLSFEGKAFQTDDPGTVLFSKLGTKTLAGRDLSPFGMNHPDSQAFEQLTLGLNFMIFEGGARLAEARFADRQFEASRTQLLHERVRTYADAASLYGVLVISESTRKELTRMRNVVQGVIENYKIGAKSNPVGYSGLLGLRNLHKRIEAELLRTQSDDGTARQALTELAREKNTDWSAAPVDLPQFLKTYLPVPSGPKPEGAGDSAESAQVLSARSAAEGAFAAAEGERARYLPRAGLFARGDYFGTSGANATSYNAGAYVQWDLFAPMNWGVVRQNQLQAESQSAMADGLRLQQHIGIRKSLTSATTVEAQLELTRQGTVLLDEQIQVARDLFRNGAINALQLSEVLSRRTDLMVWKAQLEQQLLGIRSGLLLDLPRGEQEAVLAAAGGRS